jgi:hypothetical protein
MAEFVDVFVDPNPNCPDGCMKRFKAESPPREVRVVRYWEERDRPMLCDVLGWSSEQAGGCPCPAWAVTVEDSGDGAATLIYGGNWGLILSPKNGATAFGAPYLLLAAEDVIA